METKSNGRVVRTEADWRGVGAKYVGIIQSLPRTCRLQGVDPYPRIFTPRRS